MSLQQIKTYITICNIDQITRFDTVTNEQIVRAYQCTEEMAGVAERLILSVDEGQVAIITGERGVGKSHFLAFLRSLFERPDLISTMDHPIARTRLQQALGKVHTKYTVLPIYCDHGEEIEDATALIVETEDKIAAARTEGVPKIIFIDGISHLLHVKNRDACLGLLDKLFSEAEAKGKRMVIAIDQDLLNLIDKHLSFSRVESVPLDNLAIVMDQFICKKSRSQRRALDDLYELLRRQMPHFSSTLQEFVQSYPLHPEVLKLVPTLRTYARTFSLFGFFSAVVPRAMMRKGLNLISLTELFDSFEFDLRRNKELDGLFSSYDYLTENFARALPSGQQYYGKMLLRAITLLSLSERFYSTLEIADSVMLFDESPQVLFRQSLKTVTEFMATVAGDRMLVEQEAGEAKYKLRLVPEVSLPDRIEEAARKIADDDIRLFELLVDSGSHYFQDWPLGFDYGDFKSQAEGELVWRGTARYGLVKFWCPSDIGLQSERRWEWELILLPPHADKQNGQARVSEEGLLYWFPSELSPEDIQLLKRLLVLKDKGQELLSPQELDPELAFLYKQAAQIFSRCYVELGRLGRSSETSTFPFPLEERRFTSALSNIFITVLNARYPSHPRFKRVFNEKSLRELARAFFYSSEWEKPELKNHIEQFALPLFLIKQNGQFEFSRRKDISPDSPLWRLLNMIDTSSEQEVTRTELESVLRDEPFGLQLPVLLLLLLGAAAAGHIILADDSGEIILTSAGKRSGYDIASYSRVLSGERRLGALLKEHEVSSFFKNRLDETRTSEDVQEEVPSEKEPSQELSFQELMTKAGSSAPVFVEPTSQATEVPMLPRQSFDDISVEPFTDNFPALKPPEEKSPTQDPSESPSEFQLEETNNNTGSDNYQEEQSEEYEQVSDTRLIVARKLTNEKASSKNLLLIYEKLVELSDYYLGPNPMPKFEEFKFLILRQSKIIGERSYCREIWCKLELAGDELQIHCQADRKSLFQEYPPKYRLI
jgi:hypothetical protein